MSPEPIAVAEQGRRDAMANQDEKRNKSGIMSATVLQELFALCTALLIVVVASGGVAQAAEFTVNVEDDTGNPVPGFRWLLEEDTTLPVTPGEHVTDSLSLSFHNSHRPVVTKGETAQSSAVVADVDPGKDYFISILPYTGHSMSGAPIRFSAGDPGTVTVVVNSNPLPTAQITVFAFEDNQPINNIPDLPEEQGIDGTIHPFTVALSDPAGQYGVAGGQVSQDAYGNPLGTEYAPGDPTTITHMGDGTIRLDANGVAVIKNLAPAKYGVEIIPPAGEDWHQTSTIEGTKTIDAWVKANEPPYFVEFGPPGPHVFVGFVHTINDPATLNGSATITGDVVNLHTSRPPDFAFYNGQPFPNCWVGLNDLGAGNGNGVYAAPCNADSSFSIPNVPPGNYQLVIWDNNLDIIFAFLDVTVNAGDDIVDLTDIPVFNWYSRLESFVFFDFNGNGIRDPGEQGIPNEDVTLRFRDGRIYQTFPTDLTGYVPFDEVFPFFNWLVAEVGFTRFKATGATFTVDAGGPIDPNDPSSFGGVLNPQPQAENGGGPNRTETGPVLTQAIQGYLGQTNVIEWGKGIYGPGENGGITGIIYYATTRAENDPRFAVGEEWEPGIPRVQVNLYQDSNLDGVIDDVNGDGVIQLADVDNHPFGNFPGPEDNDRNTNGTFDAGDAVNVTTSDSWDDNQPTGCQGDPYIIDGQVKDCFDGLRNFNQIRPGVFDGGYAFDAYFPGGMDSGSTEVTLPAGTYIVEAALPQGYELVKEEDRNVDFGETFFMGALHTNPVCVGDDHVVPAYFSFATDGDGNLLPGYDPAETTPPAAGLTLPLCDRKQVRLSGGQNAAADFFMFTMVPKSAHVVGMILNDLANEFDPNAPTFGEKAAPSWVPISFRDWTGREINRVYADEWGEFNAMLPSTYSVNLPSPSGVAPNMITACMNDSGSVPNPARASDPNAPAFITDPFFDRRYSQFCYTFQYMPGATTYLDTPVLPIAAFAGPNENPLDCEHPDATPLIYRVDGPDGGPYVLPGQLLTIQSAGQVDVLNPAYGAPGEPRLISRDYSFGSQRGSVMVGNIPFIVISWTPNSITGFVLSLTSTDELIVTRANGQSSPVGVTLTVGPIAGDIHRVSPSSLPGAHPIQDAIDAAAAGDLILVAPGDYDEMVIMYKPVQLQGYGALSTVINARKVPGEKLQAWRDKVNALDAAGEFDLVPGQERGFDPGGNLEPILFFSEEGAGITVLAKATGRNRFRPSPNARIDGFTVTGADHGGGIFVNGYARFLEVSNNWVVSNQGTFGGGIRFGHSNLVADTGNGLEYSDAINDRPNVHHNHVAENGNFGGAGAGISLYTGTDRYTITDNFICGNFAQADGAGIGHLGVSNNGLIADNSIIFNQSFNQGTNVNGGGVFIGGQPPLAGMTLTPGSGHVTLDGNLIQGNQAGAGDGGGIYTAFVNGQDVADNPNTQGRWYRVDMFNNMVVNNMAGYAGGGIAMQDTANPRIINNTVSNNDSTATVGNAFEPGNPNRTLPQPAGIVGRAHSAALAGAIGNNVPARFRQGFSNPRLLNNVVWQNRSFYWEVNNTTDPATFGLVPDVGSGEAPVYEDLAVLPRSLGSLNPRFCILTDTTGYHGSNTSADPQFANAYFNGDRGQTIVMPEVTTSVQAAPAFDEGGNYIEVRFGPLTPSGDYHIAAGSPAVDAANTQTIPELATDYDNQPRPQGADADIGADEAQ
jgi:parallel beta-helix repeat protein